MEGRRGYRGNAARVTGIGVRFRCPETVASNVVPLSRTLSRTRNLVNSPETVNSGTFDCQCRPTTTTTTTGILLRPESRTPRPSGCYFLQMERPRPYIQTRHSPLSSRGHPWLTRFFSLLFFFPSFRSFHGNRNVTRFNYSRVDDAFSPRVESNFSFSSYFSRFFFFFFVSLHIENEGMEKKGIQKWKRKHVTFFDREVCLKDGFVGWIISPANS